MTETWHGNIPVLTNQIINDVPDIAEDLLYLGRRFGYICDPAETDQGAAGSGRSLKDHLTTIGTSKYAVIFFPHHAADGNTTTYTLSTSLDMTSYPYVYLWFQPGAKLVIGATKTFTAYSPANILCMGYNIFTVTGTLAYYSDDGTKYGEWDGTGSSSVIPSGTKMLFYADTAPSGWTIDNTLDDKVVFVTKGSAASGQTGGGAHSTGTWTQTNHVHQWYNFVDATTADQSYDSSGNAETLTQGTKSGAGLGIDVPSGATCTNQDHYTAAGATANTWRPAAYCFIVCSKN